MPKNVLDTPSARDAMGPYSIATEASGLVYLSGQVGLIPDSGGRASEVGLQAHQAMSNIGAILGDVGLGYDDIVKTTIFLADMNDYAVVNEAYSSYFESGYPARSAVQAAGLPGGFLVEIEAVAAR